jgi:hypothetical protein
MTNESILLVENEQLFSPISQLNYSFYSDEAGLRKLLENDKTIQCIVGQNIAFGTSQQPGLRNYADGVDTMQFLLSL